MLDNYNGDIAAEMIRTGAGDMASMLPAAMLMSMPVLDFEELIMYYTERSLTNQDDILNAVGGIIQRLSRRMKCRFLEGLPTAAFDLSILFACKDTTFGRRHGFPSYSWAGWRGKYWYILHRHSDDNIWLTESTWIVWYKRSARGTLNLVWDFLANEDFPYHDDMYIGYRKRRAFQSPVPVPFPTSRTQPTEDLGRMIPVLNYPVLQFWTLSALFNIRMENRFEGIARIINRFGESCGRLWLDDHEGSVALGSAERPS